MASPAQVGQDGHRGVDRPPGHRVDGVLELVERQGLCRGRLNDPGHGDENLDGPDLVLHPPDEIAHGVAIAHVTHFGRDRTVGMQVAERAIDLVAVPRGCYDVVAAVEQFAGNEEPESTGCSQDDGHGTARATIPCVRRVGWCRAGRGLRGHAASWLTVFPRDRHG